MKTLTYLFLLVGLIACDTSDESEAKETTPKEEVKPTLSVSKYSVRDYLIQEMANMNDYNAMGDPKYHGLWKRQIFDIKINSEDEVIAREELLENMDLLKHRVKAFYLMNEDLTSNQMRLTKDDPGARGFDYPIYFAADEKFVTAILADYKKVKVKSAIEQEFLDKRIGVLKDWQTVVRAFPDNRFKFIDHRILLRIFPLEGASEKRVDEVREIIIESIRELRNEFSKELFDMNYTVLYGKYETSGRKEYVVEMKTINALVPMIVADIPNISPRVEKHLNESQQAIDAPPPPPIVTPPPTTVDVIEMENEEELPR